MPSMGGSATLISAPHLGDLLDVDMSAKVDQSIPSWQAGAAKYEPMPGVVGDGNSGLAITRSLQVGTATNPFAAPVPGNVNMGDKAAAVADGPSTLIYYGTAGFFDSPAIADDNGPVLDVTQQEPLIHDYHEATLATYRSSPLNGHLFVEAAHVVQDSVSAAPETLLLSLKSSDGAKLQANLIGGLGLFGATPPTAQPAITGALSTVVDPAAKAVLTSLLALLTGMGAASDGTT